MNLSVCLRCLDAWWRTRCFAIHCSYVYRYVFSQPFNINTDSYCTLLFAHCSYQSFLMVYLCKRMSLLFCCVRPIYLFCYLYKIPIEHPFQCDVLTCLYYNNIISNIQEHKEDIIWCCATQILALVCLSSSFVKIANLV